MTKKDLLPRSVHISKLEPHFYLPPDGHLQHTGDPSFKECEVYLKYLKDLEIKIPWAIGDMLNFIDDKFGDYSQVVDSFDYSVRYLANIKSVTKAFPPSRRRERVPMAYYQDIQGLEENIQEKLLDMVEAERITSSRIMREVVRKIKKSIVRDKLEPPKDCFHSWITTCADCGKVLIDV